MAFFKVFTRNLHSTKALCNTVLHPPNPKEYTKSKELWKKLTYFVAFPAIGLCMVNAYLSEKEHMEHLEHHRPEFVKYEYMYIRKRKFPWGDGNKTLFHNPKVNALPEGYEE